MKTSPAGIALIEEFEGCRRAAYTDQNGIWTVGFGHTEGVKAGQYETQAEADEHLRSDLASAERAVERLVKVPLTQCQFDAISSFVFNEGQGRFASSTVLRKLNAKDYAGAANAFRAWDVIAGKESKGLDRRREAEIALFSSEPWNPPDAMREA